jgi:tyrosyl-DNA phosphodiesterase 1
MSPPERKRRRTDRDELEDTHSLAADIRARRSAFLTSLSRGVSPPGRASPSFPITIKATVPIEAEIETETVPVVAATMTSLAKPNETVKHRVIPSPFKLTRIRDLPAEANVDTIGVRDILGDVMLKEVWLFDFLFDVDWIM